MSLRLHIGCGEALLPGWRNIDSHPLPGVDQLLDVRDGLPFENVETIFAEHFIEHLTLAEALRFFAECRRVLKSEGVLRISTPNLDWVWRTHYLPPGELDAETAVTACLELNRAFHGWGHRFLWNGRTLASALRGAGFSVVAEQRYGESGKEELRNLERHERAADLDGIPHVLIVEASGKSGAAGTFSATAAPYLRDFEIS